MIDNLLIIVFFALWTFLFLVLILIGCFLEKKYKLATITPEIKSFTPQNSVIYLNHIQNSNSQKQSQQKRDSQIIEDIISNQRMYSQQQIQQQDNENGIKMLNETAQKETLTKQTPIKLKKQQKQIQAQTIFSRKPIIGILEGIETVQSTNRKSVRSRQSGNNSERNSISGFTGDQKPINHVKIHSISSFQTNGNLLAIQNGKIPKPSKDYYKCISFAKIFYSHKEGLSRIFMVLQIYFRQIICFEICCALLLYLEQLQYYYIMGFSCGGYLVIKIYDYYIIKFICKNRRGFVLKLISYIIWGGVLSILILGIMFVQLNNLRCLQYYSPALLLELLIVDPIKYFLIKNCQAIPRIRIKKQLQNNK